MTLETAKEYLDILRTRYKASANRKDKSQIINECLVNTDITNRKSAIRTLNRSCNKYRKKGSGAKKVYNFNLIKPLKAIWINSNRACSKNLKPEIQNLINNMLKFNEIKLYEDQKEKLLRMSTGTIDRLLKAERKQTKGISGTRCSPHLKKLIPIRTHFDANTKIGDLEIDCVLHCGDSLSGTYAETLNMVDIETLWSERQIFLNKNKEKVVGALHVAVTGYFPFPIHSIDFDNGYEFVNYKMHEYCKIHNLKFTRSRSYHKNDQANIEERNGHIVRGIIGYARITDPQIVEIVQSLYDNEVHLLSNFFWPVRKLVYKEKSEDKNIKRYDKARTPYARVMASRNVSMIIKQRLYKQYKGLNVAELTRSMTDKLKQIKQLSLVTPNYWATTVGEE